MKNICHKLPKSIGDECGSLINTYGDAIFFLVSQELDPAVFCVQLQLCPSSSAEEIQLPENPFKGNFSISRFPFANFITDTLFMLAPASEDPNTCALCEFVITMLDRKLEDNRTEDSIKEALEGVCQRLPKSVEKDCVRLVDAYSKEIVEMLLADLKPDEVCAALKMCQPKSFETIESNLILSNELNIL